MKKNWKNIVLKSAHYSREPGQQYPKEHYCSYDLGSQDIEEKYLDEVLDQIQHKEQNRLQKCDLMIYLYNNPIGDPGCSQIARRQWNKLSILHLSNTNISSRGCYILSKQQWDQLKIFYCNANLLIDQKACRHLSKTQWPQLMTFSACDTNIGVKGCWLLVKAKWLFLKHLKLDDTQIGTKGCEYLSLHAWPKLETINLQSNKISQQGNTALAQSCFKATINTSQKFKIIWAQTVQDQIFAL